MWIYKDKGTEAGFNTAKEQVQFTQYFYFNMTASMGL